MTVIYVDTLFLLNAIVDYLLLLCSARLAGELKIYRQAREKAVQTENAAKAQADRIMADAEQAEGAELESLRSAVTEKSDQAVKAVLAELL